MNTSSIAITGDSHGERSQIDYWKKKWIKKPFSTLIIAGDAGYVWDPFDIKEQRCIREIDSLPFDIFVIGGNHENYSSIYASPLESYCGGRVYRVSKNLRYAQHGHIFNIYDTYILSFGGAESIDKAYRTEGRSWWKEEIPSYEDCMRAATNIGKYYAESNHLSKKLIVISHTAPTEVINTLPYTNFENNDPVCRMLSHMKTLLSNTQKIDWYFGHHHKDGIIRRLDNITFYGVYHKLLYI